MSTLFIWMYIYKYIIFKWCHFLKDIWIMCFHVNMRLHVMILHRCSLYTFSRAHTQNTPAKWINKITNEKEKWKTQLATEESRYKMIAFVWTLRGNRTWINPYGTYRKWSNTASHTYNTNTCYRRTACNSVLQCIRNIST